MSGLALPKPSLQPGRRTFSAISHNGQERVDSRSSSINVWKEDFLADDYAFEENENKAFEKRNIVDLSAAAGLDQDDDDEEGSILRTARPKLTTLLPFRKSRANSTSPVRSPVHQNATTNILGGEENEIVEAPTEEKRSGGLASWFTGASTPMALGVPVAEFEAKATQFLPPSTSTSRTPSPERAKLRKRPTMATMASSNTVSNQTLSSQTSPSEKPSRFSFFSTPSKPAQKTMSIPLELNDDLINANLTTLLFPSGAPSPTDAFSPSAFKNLLQNAKGVLSKLQTAYQLRTIALAEVISEKEGLQEEIEEADERTKHLKMQLREMAEAATLHEIEIAMVKADLEQEREERRRERLEREESIRLIREKGSSDFEPGHLQSHSHSVIPSRLSEDLEIDIAERRRLRSRMSERSFESDVDGDGEGEGMSEGGSVFSRCLSPTGTVDTTTTGSTGEVREATLQAVRRISIPAPAAATESPVPAANKSAASTPKAGLVVKGLGLGRMFGSATPTVESCRNCRGGDTAVAWDTVGLLRAENRGLKERVGELEGSVEGCLDLVRGLGLDL